jgi:hypothetical protein
VNSIVLQKKIILIVIIEYHKIYLNLIKVLIEYRKKDLT